MENDKLFEAYRLTHKKYDLCLLAFNLILNECKESNNYKIAAIIDASLEALDKLDKNKT